MKPQGKKLSIIVMPPELKERKMVSQRKRAEAKVGKGEVSVKQLKGMFCDPKRKPASIEEMNEAVMQAVVEADIRTRMQTTKR
jgi:hypothetical protein